MVAQLKRVLRRVGRAQHPHVERSLPTPPTRKGRQEHTESSSTEGPFSQFRFMSPAGGRADGSTEALTPPLTPQSAAKPGAFGGVQGGASIGPSHLTRFGLRPHVKTVPMKPSCSRAHAGKIRSSPDCSAHQLPGNHLRHHTTNKTRQLRPTVLHNDSFHHRCGRPRRLQSRRRPCCRTSEGARILCARGACLPALRRLQAARRGSPGSDPTSSLPGCPRKVNGRQRPNVPHS